jgi:tetratricopeptide (TPR) repeat protein
MEGTSNLFPAAIVARPRSVANQKLRGIGKSRMRVVGSRDPRIGLGRGALLVVGLAVACATTADPVISWEARTADAELERALDAEAKGEREQALELGGRALQHAREAAALGTVGRALLLVGRTEPDLMACLDAIEVFEHEDDRAGVAEAQVEAAGLLLDLGRPDDALIHARASRSALTEAELGRTPWARLSARIHHTTAEALRALERADEARAEERQADLALSLLDDADLLKLRVEVQLALGVDDELQGEPSRAIEHHSRALSLARKTGDQQAQLAALTGVVSALTGLQRYADAVSHCERALELAREVGDVGQVQELGRRGLQLLALMGDEAGSARRRDFEQALLTGT